MYFIKNKSQLNSFVNSIREHLLASSFKFSPKPSKLKETVVRCMGFNSYAGAISKLPIDTDEFKYAFLKAFTKILMTQPYSLIVDSNEIEAIYDNAITDSAYWDDEGQWESIIMASESC